MRAMIAAIPIQELRHMIYVYAELDLSSAPSCTTSPRPVSEPLLQSAQGFYRVAAVFVPG